MTKESRIYNGKRTASSINMTSDNSHKPRLLSGSLTHWLYTSEVAKPFSLGSINFLEWLPELRETIYLPDSQFIIQVYNSGTARCKRYIGPSIWK